MIKSIIYKQFRENRNYYIVVALATVVLEIIYIINPLIIKRIIDSVVSKNSERLILCVVCGLLIIQLDSVFSYFESKYIATNSSLIKKSLRQNIFNKMQRLPLSFFKDKGIGEIRNRLDDINIISEYIEYIIFNIGFSVFKLVGLLVPMMMLCWKLSLAYFVFAVGEIAVNKYYSKNLKRLKKFYKEKTDSICSFIHDRIGNIELIKYYQYEDKNNKDYDNKLDAERKSYIELNNKTIRLNFFSALIRTNADYMLIALGCYFILNDMITIGTLFALRAFAGRLQKPISNLAQFHVNQKLYQVDFERISEILFKECEESLWNGKPHARICNGNVEFANVSFKYEGNKYILSNINFNLNSGELLVICGQSGVGKTTLVNLLLGIHKDYDGLIKIDGMDLREYSLNEIRKNIGYVTQKNYLLNDSIGKNIELSTGGGAYNNLEKHLVDINLEYLINNKNRCNESNPSISGGEMQRLSIIRMLLRSPKICILDEATSSLDEENKSRVIHVVEELKKQGRTIIIVSHNADIMKYADRVLFLNNGEVAEHKCANALNVNINDHIELQQHLH